MEVSRYDLAPLALLCGIQESDPLPKEVVEQYGRVRRLFSRVAGSGPLPPVALVMIGMAAGLGGAKPCDVVKDTFEDLVRKGEVKPNDRISVQWRGEYVEATFTKIRSDHRVGFRLDGKKEELAVAVDKAKKLAKT